MAEVNAGAVINRMREAVGVRTDLDLASHFGLGSSAVSNWRARNTVPFKECVNLSIRKGISLDWLILGSEGGAMNDQHMVQDRSPTDERLMRLRAFLAHWDTTRGDDDKVWLEMQVARAVPEYAEWLAARGKSNY